MNTEMLQNTVMLPPEALLVTGNIRFGLKSYRVDALAGSIQEFGRVHTNLKVEALPEPGPHGELYSIREGHYRHAAVAKLNKSGAGLELPCTVEPATEGLERLKFQISENLDRENLSPMDMAIAIKELLDAGLQKVEIRQMFQRPGGRKGMAMQPMSNSTLNIYVSFLEFPKPIQKKIHDGTLGVADAYKLTTKPKELWTEILEAAEASRIKGIDSEEAQETKFLEGEQKAAEQKAKEDADKAALEAAQKVAEVAKADAQAKLDAAAVAYKAAQAVPAKDKDAKKAAAEKFTAAETEAKVAEKAATSAQTEADKLQKKVETAQQTAADRKAKLDAARAQANAATPAPATGKLNIDAAAAAVTGMGHVALNALQMRKVVSDMCLPGSFPKVKLIAEALKRCFDGITTDGQLVNELGFITGERKERPKTMPK